MIDVSSPVVQAAALQIASDWLREVRHFRVAPGTETIVAKDALSDFVTIRRYAEFLLEICCHNPEEKTAGIIEPMLQKIRQRGE
jgi:hypothetical protein